MTRQTGRLGLPAQRPERRAAIGTGMRRLRHRSVNVQMTGNAYFGTRIVRRRTGDAEKGIAVKLGDGGRAGRIFGTAHCRPRRGRAVASLEKLIIARRPIPNDLNPVGHRLDGAHDWHPRHPARLGGGKMLHRLGRRRQRPETNAGQGQDKQSH